MQVLPSTLLAPLLGIIDELATDWGCTFVLSTATKPAFETRSCRRARTFAGRLGKVEEIGVTAPAETSPSPPPRLHRLAHLKNPLIGHKSLRGCWNRGRHYASANLRDHAALLFDELDAGLQSDRLFHLYLACVSARIGSKSSLIYDKGLKQSFLASSSLRS